MPQKQYTDEYDYIDDSPAYVENIANLIDWGQNYPDRYPTMLFFDLVGISKDRYGKSMSGLINSSKLGYVEIDKLANALKEYADRPRDVRDWINGLLDIDDWIEACKSCGPSKGGQPGKAGKGDKTK